MDPVPDLINIKGKPGKVELIKNMLRKRKESDTYLATVSRHRWSRGITMKIDKYCICQLALWLSSAEDEDK